MTDRYPALMRVLHWLVAVLIISLLAVGLYMTGLEDEDPSRGLIYTIHKATGVMVLLFAVWRLSVRLKSAIPPLPTGIVAWERRLSEVTHRTLYLFMFLMPISGMWMSNAFGHGVNMYGLFTIPPLFPENPDIGGIAHEVHEYGAYVLIALLLAHVGGVLKHRYIDKHDVLHRMTWGKIPTGTKEG